MPGRLIDLARPDVRLPDPLIVDTNLVVARLLAAERPPHPETAERAARFFDLLHTQGALGLLPPVVIHEVFHVAIREHYQRVVPDYQAVLADALPRRRRFTWNDLYKLRPRAIAFW